MIGYNIKSIAVLIILGVIHGICFKKGHFIAEIWAFTMFLGGVRVVTLHPGVATGPAPGGVIMYISKNYRCR